MNENDEFTEAMWQHMLLVNQEATKKINLLRAEIKVLRAELKDRDPQLWEMAEEIAALQLKLNQRRDNAMNQPEDKSSSSTPRVDKLGNSSDWNNITQWRSLEDAQRTRLTWMTELARQLERELEESETERKRLRGVAGQYYSQMCATQEAARPSVAQPSLEPLFNAVRDCMHARAFSEPTTVINAERALIKAYGALQSAAPSHVAPQVSESGPVPVAGSPQPASAAPSPQLKCDYCYELERYGVCPYEERDHRPAACAMQAPTALSSTAQQANSGDPWAALWSDLISATRIISRLCSIIDATPSEAFKGWPSKPYEESTEAMNFVKKPHYFPGSTAAQSATRRNYERVFNAVMALTDGDYQLTCIPFGPERDELQAAIDEAKQ